MGNNRVQGQDAFYQTKAVGLMQQFDYRVWQKALSPRTQLINVSSFSSPELKVLIVYYL